MIENAYVCFFDVLGFTSSFISGTLSKRYDGLIEMMNSRRDPDVTIFLMSDSIFCVYADLKKIIKEIKIVSVDEIYVYFNISEDVEGLNFPILLSGTFLMPPANNSVTDSDNRT